MIYCDWKSTLTLNNRFEVSFYHLAFYGPDIKDQKYFQLFT